MTESLDRALLGPWRPNDGVPRRGPPILGISVRFNGRKRTHPKMETEAHERTLKPEWTHSDGCPWQTDALPWALRLMRAAVGALPGPWRPFDGVPR